MFCTFWYITTNLGSIISNMNRFIIDKNNRIITLTSGEPKKALERFVGKENIKSIKPLKTRYKAETKSGDIYYINR